MFSFLSTFCRISFPGSHQNLLPLQSWYIKAKQPSSYADRLLSPESTPFVRQWMPNTTVFISQLIEERPLKTEYPGAQDGCSISKLTSEAKQTTAAPSSPLTKPESVFHQICTEGEKGRNYSHLAMLWKTVNIVKLSKQRTLQKLGRKYHTYQVL